MRRIKITELIENTEPIKDSDYIVAFRNPAEPLCRIPMSTLIDYIEKEAKERGLEVVNMVDRLVIR